MEAFIKFCDIFPVYDADTGERMKKEWFEKLYKNHEEVDMNGKKTMSLTVELSQIKRAVNLLSFVTNNISQQMDELAARLEPRLLDKEKPDKAVEVDERGLFLIFRKPASHLIEEMERTYSYLEEISNTLCDLLERLV